jgi:hypothetical protein
LNVCNPGTLEISVKRRKKMNIQKSENDERKSCIPLRRRNGKYCTKITEEQLQLQLTKSQREKGERKIKGRPGNLAKRESRIHEPTADWYTLLCSSHC